MYLSNADMALAAERREVRLANLDLAINKRTREVQECQDEGRQPPPKPACPYDDDAARARWAVCP